MLLDNTENDILTILKQFNKNLPKFPDGRINYTNSRESAVLNVFVEYDGKFLFLKRSDKVIAYRGKWSTIVGFLDEVKPVREKILEELKEEAGITKKHIQSVFIGNIIRREDKEINRVWIICPVLVKLKERPEIKMDWEHTEFKWVTREEINKMDTLPNMGKVLDSVLK